MTVTPVLDMTNFIQFRHYNILRRFASTTVHIVLFRTLFINSALIYTQSTLVVSSPDSPVVWREREGGEDVRTTIFGLMHNFRSQVILWNQIREEKKPVSEWWCYAIEGEECFDALPPTPFNLSFKFCNEKKFVIKIDEFFL